MRGWTQTLEALAGYARIAPAGLALVRSTGSLCQSRSGGRCGEHAKLATRVTLGRKPEQQPVTRVTARF